MTLPLTREEAVALLKEQGNGEQEMNHYFEAEAIMKGLAKEFGEDEKYWGMIGLLHDVDWAFTKENIQEHCVMMAEILREKGFDDEFIHTVQSHGYSNERIPALMDKKRSKKIEYSLAAAETMTGIIYAYALMREKNISTMAPKGLKKKFKDKNFAQKCNRELIREIENTGLELSKFFEISIEAMKGIKEQLNLS